MDKFNELLKELKKTESIQKDCWEENISEVIWNKHFQDNYKEVKANLSIDRHRHYETSITVIKIYEKYLGIKHISKVYSEISSYRDCCVVIEFYEMEEVPTFTYKIK